MNFTAVIPTYNREKDLAVCFASILIQTELPNEVLIIDDGELPTEYINNIKLKAVEKKIKFVYYKKDHQKERRGLSESKNKALELVSNNIFFILDDDLVLDDDFFEKIMDVWRENNDKNLIGVGGLIKNSRKKNSMEKIYNKIFGLTGECEWDINELAFQVWDEHVEQTTKGYYAHGGVCSYDLSLAKKLGFTTFAGGRTALEDVDFCLRAKNLGYHFIFEPKAKVIHNESPVGREKMFLIGYKEGKNRKIIFQNNCQKNFKNYIWFIWANVGWTLRQFLVGNFRKGMGMVKGLVN